MHKWRKRTFPYRGCDALSFLLAASDLLFVLCTKLCHLFSFLLAASDLLFALCTKLCHLWSRTQNTGTVRRQQVVSGTGW
jgi:hypothetical protein|eukprot:COSAG06_NODE_3338_length_5488_cov_13.771015_4_plen_80_part_00